MVNGDTDAALNENGDAEVPDASASPVTRHLLPSPVTCHQSLSSVTSHYFGNLPKKPIRHR
jgi:hypothetical protein